MGKKFFIAKRGSVCGPSIFGDRLAAGLKDLGHIETQPQLADNLIHFVTGEYWQGKNNLLRLDNLWLDSKNTVGDSLQMNRPIFECYKRFDKIIFQSKYAKKVFESFTDFVHPNAHVIYNGVGREFYAYDKENNRNPYPSSWKKVMICSASWRTHKRLDQMIEAFKMIPNNGSLGMAILGQYPGDIRELIDGNKQIRYLGNLHPSLLPQFYAYASFMCHLSFIDCMPNSCIEGIAAGCPLMVSSNGGTREIVEQNGMYGKIFELEEPYNYKLIDLYNPPQIDLEKVALYMQHMFDFRERYGNRADFFQFKIEKIAKQYAELFV